MIRGTSGMAPLKRLLSSVLLAGGVGLVLIGFSAALGFTAAGVIASVAAVAALLYAGATWFGGRVPVRARRAAVTAPVVVFDCEYRIVGGPLAGERVSSRYPEPLRPEIDRHCAAALAGTSARFACVHAGQTFAFDTVPVRSADGRIVYGILLTTDSVAAAMAATA